MLRGDESSGDVKLPKPIWVTDSDGCYECPAQQDHVYDKGKRTAIMLYVRLVIVPGSAFSTAAVSLLSSHVTRLTPSVSLSLPGRAA